MSSAPSEPVDLAKARRERYALLTARGESRALADADEERERVAWQRRAGFVLVEARRTAASSRAITV